MIENTSIPSRNESTAAPAAPASDAPRVVPLGRLADEEHDTERASVVRRLIDADTAATRVPVSAFSSSI
jgi:FXSXX-COOH protein